MRHFLKVTAQVLTLTSIVYVAACTTTSNNQRSTSSVVNELQSGFTCEQPVIFKGQSLTNCKMASTNNNPPKEFQLLHLKGKQTDMQYAHGYMLAEEIEDGSIAELINTINALRDSKPKVALILDSVKKCYVNRMERSVSPEFLAIIDALEAGYADGMRAKGKTPKYTKQDFRDAILGIDLGNVVEGLFHEIQTKPVQGILDILGTCGLKLTGAAIKEIFVDYEPKTPSDDRKMGCVGAAVAAKGTTENKLLHGRNLDQTGLIESWGKHPVMFMVEEEGAYKYMGTGTAGLIFPAGISGMNEHQLSVTLHQMSTTRYDSLYRKHNAMIMPYLLEQTLKRSKNIDEVFNIIKNTEVFASWTVFITDAKTNEMASIEVAAKNKVIARRNINSYMGQSNHFINQDMKKEHFMETYNNLLETHSRLNITEKRLKDSFGKIDLEWMIKHLSLHEDFFEGQRSFGRTPVKAANLMSTIAVPQDGTYWMTVADRSPAAHSQYIAVKADWKKGTMTPFQTARTNTYRNQPNLEASYASYVEAYKLNHAEDYKGAIKYLEQARQEAALDGVKDFTYDYNLARLKHLQGDADAGYELMSNLWMNRTKNNNHEYQQALVTMYTARMGEDLSNSEKRWKHKDAVPYYELSKKYFEKILADAYPDHATLNLKQKIKTLNKWIKGKKAKTPSLVFSVVD